MNNNSGQSQNKKLLVAAAGVAIGAGLYFVLNSLMGKEENKHVQKNSVRQPGNSSRDKKYSESILRSNNSLSSSPNQIQPSNLCSTSNTGNAENNNEEYHDAHSDQETLPSRAENAFGCETDILFKEVDLLLKGSDEDCINAFNLLKETEEKYSRNPEFLWRFAQAHQIQSLLQEDIDFKKKYILKGLEYASKALEVDSTNDGALKWFKILTELQTELCL